jgi:hypothetical protein
MQNYKNHRQVVFSYHILTWLPAIALLIGAIINLVNSSKENLYSASLIVLIALLLISIMLHARSFALKAQDRAIRAEENLRHFILTGRPQDARLSLEQVIALRFASDEEFPALAQRAAEEKLTNKQIKLEVKHWRPDHHRV